MKMRRLSHICVWRRSQPGLGSASIRTCASSHELPGGLFSPAALLVLVCPQVFTSASSGTQPCVNICSWANRNMCDQYFQAWWQGTGGGSRCQVSLQLEPIACRPLLVQHPLSGAAEVPGPGPVMTVPTAYQVPTQVGALYHHARCFTQVISAPASVRPSLLSPIFQMRGLNRKEIMALSCNSWGLFRLSGPQATWDRVR